MKKIFLTATILTLSACSNQNSLTLELSNADGLTTSSPIYSNGLKIGEVSKLKLTTNQTVLAAIELTSELQNLPIDSKIGIFSDDLFGNKAINIELGKSSTYFTSTDTLQLSATANEQTAVEPDPISKAIGEGINMLTSQDKLDSILIELRRLNENLEEHMKEHNSR